MKTRSFSTFLLLLTLFARLALATEPTAEQTIQWLQQNLDRFQTTYPADRGGYHHEVLAIEQRASGMLQIDVWYGIGTIECYGSKVILDLAKMDVKIPVIQNGDIVQLELRAIGAEGIVAHKASVFWDSPALLTNDNDNTGNKSQWFALNDIRQRFDWMFRFKGVMQQKRTSIFFSMKDRESAERVAKALSHLIKLHGGKEDDLFK